MSRGTMIRGMRWLLVPVILAAGVGAWYLNASRDQVTPEEVARSVEVARPTRRDLEEAFSIRAFVEADETVTVLPLVSGPIEDLPVDVGDRVAAEEVIARIDRERYALDLAQAEASLDAAESTFLRTQQLYEANATSVQNFEQARAQFEAAQSRRDLAELQLTYTRVRSPIDGVILARHLADGDVAAPDRPIVTVGDLSRLLVRPAVPEERYADFLSDPAAITVRVTAGNETYPATIRTVAPSVSPETRTFEVVCEIGGDRSRLRPGMSVSVTFVPAVRRDVLTVPVAALGYGETLWALEDGRARRLPVEAPQTVDGFVVLPDRYADTTFIIAGQHFLSDGQPARIGTEER